MHACCHNVSDGLGTFDIFVSNLNILCSKRQWDGAKSSSVAVCLFVMVHYPRYNRRRVSQIQVYFSVPLRLLYRRDLVRGIVPTLRHVIHARLRSSWLQSINSRHCWLQLTIVSIRYTGMAGIPRESTTPLHGWYSTWVFVTLI